MVISTLGTEDPCFLVDDLAQTRRRAGEHGLNLEVKSDFEGER